MLPGNDNITQGRRWSSHYQKTPRVEKQNLYRVDLKQSLLPKTTAPCHQSQGSPR